MRITTSRAALESSTTRTVLDIRKSFVRRAASGRSCGRPEFGACWLPQAVILFFTVIGSAGYAEFLLGNVTLRLVAGLIGVGDAGGDEVLAITGPLAGLNLRVGPRGGHALLSLRLNCAGHDRFGLACCGRLPG